MADRDVPSTLERLVREGSDRDIQRFFALLRPPEIADLLEALPEDCQIRVVRLLGAELSAEVIREVQEPEKDDLLEDLPAKEIAEIVHESRSDDAADILGSLDPDKAERTLQNLDQEEQDELRELMEYGEETAGGIMQTELVSVPADATVGQALEAVQQSDKGEVGKIYRVYVLDADGRLLGTITPTDLLQADPEALVRDKAAPNPVKVLVDVDQEKIARLAQENDLAAIPVIDHQGKLVGQVLHDDIVDVVQEEATEDIARMAGTDDEEFYDDSVFVAVRSRASWLLLTLIGGLLVAGFLSNVHGDIKNVAALIAFLPVVLGMAGNVGGQTAAITVRSLALGRLDYARWIEPVARQIAIGIVLGMIFGGLLFLYATLTGDGSFEARRVSLTLSIAIFAAMTTGAIMGVMVPLGIHRLGLDPAISSSPFIQTVNDLTGAGIIYLVARATGLIG
ncbi:MAG: magnesium transporter [Planctomycetota bacterium]